MANDIQKKTGTIQQYKDDRGGSVLIPHPVIGIVKSNVDPKRNGGAWIYIENYGGMDPNDINNWIWCEYMSPYYGLSTDPDSKKNKDTTGPGSFINNLQSYGMWTGSPSIGSKVICIFINGRPEQGYYIGYIVPPGLHSMVPAVAASSNVVPNGSEATSYGGATRLPTSEVNIDNPSVRNSRTILSDPKPVHSYQTSLLSNQGLVRDNVRGTIGSSSTRESPSAVIGISTPGRPIYEGGYNNKTIEDAVKSADNSKLKQVGSIGGHSFVMDDGSLKGEDQLIRIRTGAGHQIMMSDSGQTFFIIHSNGQSWIELGKEGTVDIYASNSFNVRTVGDINFHADRDINLHAKRNLNMYGESVKIDSDKNTQVYSGQDIAMQSIGKYSVKVGETASIESEGNSNYSSKGTNYITGKPIHLNTGSGPEAATVPKTTFNNHKDTIYSQEVGWMYPGPDPLISIATRAPAHQPWEAAGKGVDVQIKQTAPAAEQQPSEQVQEANKSASSTPNNPTTPEAAQTVPAQQPIKCGSDTAIDAPTVKAAVSQQAATNTSLSDAQKAAQGIVPGVAGLTIKQLEGNVTKIGTSEFIADKINAGVSFAESAGKTLMTGVDGAKTAAQLVSNPTAQVATVTKSMQTAVTGLVKEGVISGKEGATQITGVVMAAANFGAKTVTDLLKSPATAVMNAVSGGIEKVKAISNMVSSGNFAAGMADKLMSGAKGLVSGIGGAVAAGVAGITATLQSVAKKAFSMVESSFGKLKAGIANPLGGLKAARELSDAEKQIAKLNSAKDEVQQAENNLREAKKLARQAGDSADNSLVQQSESLLAQAKQKTAQLSSQLTVGSSNAEETANKLAKTGINAISGGVGAVAAQVTGGISNALTSVKEAATKITNLIGKK